jgi:hypothetical protein
MTCSSEEMESLGIKTGMKKYILSWREWYKRGRKVEAVEIPERQKKHLVRKEAVRIARLKKLGLA